MIQSYLIDLKKMNTQILMRINAFIKNRVIELLGSLMALTSIFLLLSISSYSPSDPNFIYNPEGGEINNLGGFYGSVASDFLLQALGLISFFIVLNLFYWGFKLLSKKRINNFIPKIFSFRRNCFLYSLIEYLVKLIIMLNKDIVTIC